MVPELTRPSRRSIRLSGHDYRGPGAYFVTICTLHRRPLFGRIVDGHLRLNVFGAIAEKCWSEIPLHFPYVRVDEFVVMPEHCHSIILLDPTRHLQSSPNAHIRQQSGARGTAPGSLGAIIGAYKSAVTRKINRLRGTPGAQVWLRNYYESIVRDDESLGRIRRYIRENPRRASEMASGRGT